MADKENDDRGSVPGRKEKVKFYVEMGLAFLAVVSLVFNVIQYADARRADRERQPGPIIDHLVTRAIDGQILQGLLSKDPAVLLQFPNCAFADTPSYRSAREAVLRRTPIELQRVTWHFLVIRNMSDTAYRDLVPEVGGTALATVPTLMPKSTLFVFLEPSNATLSGRVSFAVAGSNSKSGVDFAAGDPASAKVRLISQLGDLKMYNVEGVDDRTRELMKSLSQGPVTVDR